MSETADLRRKAETCIRLAEAASSARANELFKRMADEYRAQADELERPVASPPLAPPVLNAETDSITVWAASEPAHEVEDTGSEPAHEVEDTGSPCLAPMPEMTVPQAPHANSAQWLAELQALRNRL